MFDHSKKLSWSARLIYENKYVKNMSKLGQNATFNILPQETSVDYYPWLVFISW